MAHNKWWLSCDDVSQVAKQSAGLLHMLHKLAVRLLQLRIALNQSPCDKRCPCSHAVGSTRGDSRSGEGEEGWDCGVKREP